MGRKEEKSQSFTIIFPRANNKWRTNSRPISKKFQGFKSMSATNFKSFFRWTQFELKKNQFQSFYLWIKICTNDTPHRWYIQIFWTRNRDEMVVFRKDELGCCFCCSLKRTTMAPAWQLVNLTIHCKTLVHNGSGSGDNTSTPIITVRAAPPSSAAAVVVVQSISCWKNKKKERTLI